MLANTEYVSSWKSIVLSVEAIKPPATSDNSLSTALSYYDTITRVKFTVSCLKQPKAFIHSWKYSKHLYCLLTKCF